MKIITVGNSNVGKTVFIMHVFGHQRLDPSMETKVTLGFEASTIHVCDTEGTLQSITLYDTAGQERFAKLTSSYMRKADGVLLMFDVSNAESFADITLRWVPEIVRSCGLDYNATMPSITEIEAPTKRLVQEESNAQAAREGGRPFTYEEMERRVRDGVAGEYMRYIAEMDMPIVLVGNKTDLVHSRCITPEQGRQLAERMGVAYCECSARVHDRDTLSDILEALVNMILERKYGPGAREQRSLGASSSTTPSSTSAVDARGPRTVVLVEDSAPMNTTSLQIGSSRRVTQSAPSTPPPSIPTSPVTSPRTSNTPALPPAPIPRRITVATSTPTKQLPPPVTLPSAVQNAPPSVSITPSPSRTIKRPQPPPLTSPTSSKDEKRAPVRALQDVYANAAPVSRDGIIVLGSPGPAAPGKGSGDSSGCC